jgi:xanthine dehydrogenase accessory factor
MERAYVPDVCDDQVAFGGRVASPYATLAALARSGTRAALATVVAADGSTPQVPGASAVFTARGLAGGTVGGGVGEARVEALARRAIAAGASRLATLNLGYDPSAEGEAICGGRLRVLIDARPERHVPVFLEMMADVRRRKPGTLVTWIKKARGARDSAAKGDLAVADVADVPGGVDVRRFWLPAGASPLRAARSALAAFDGPLRTAGWSSDGRAFGACCPALRAGAPGLFEGEGGTLYVEPHAPFPRLIIAGAGHVGRAVAHLGHLLNFEVIVIDDRPEFANADRFPEASRIVVADASRALRKLVLGPDAYVVIVTRGHRGDEGALRACIRRKTAYVGMIGSARKVGLLRERFLQKGWCSPAEWDRVRTPIGLPIGSRTVEEIAVSIAAELVAVRSILRK